MFLAQSDEDLPTLDTDIIGDRVALSSKSRCSMRELYKHPEG